MKCGAAFLFLPMLLLIALTGCVEKPASKVAKSTPPEVEVVISEPPVEVAPLEDPPETAPPVEAPEPAEVAVTDPESLAPVEVPKVLDPATRARVVAIESQIAKLSENLDNARTTITEAKAFHIELAAIYQAEEEKLAAEKAERVFERMRRSSCGG